MQYVQEFAFLRNRGILFGGKLSTHFVQECLSFVNLLSPVNFKKKFHANILTDILDISLIFSFFTTFLYPRVLSGNHLHRHY